MSGHDAGTPRRSWLQLLHLRSGTPRHGSGHHRRGVLRRFWLARDKGIGALAAFLAVLGPGLLAGLSDDDPAGITTYSILGAEFGYRLLWIIPASTILLVQFHLLALRIGAASGQGFVGAVRQRWGVHWGYLAALGMLFANFGTICAEYAGVAAACGLIGIPAWFSAPLAAVLISLVVALGSFHRTERVLLVISASLALYLVDGILAAPDWSQVARGALIPRCRRPSQAGSHLPRHWAPRWAPWGLAFLQSYAVDKKITLADLRWERVDVIIGSLLTGLIGIAIAVACAATLHVRGIHIADARDAAISLRPLAGSMATTLFGAGLLGASLLAAAIVPLATAYSIAEAAGAAASLDLESKHFHLFYAAFVGLTVAAAAVVAIPGLPLIPLIYSSQVVNAVLLPLHVIALLMLARDARLMRNARIGRGVLTAGIVSLVLILACVGAMAWSSVRG